MAATHHATKDWRDTNGLLNQHGSVFTNLNTPKNMQPLPPYALENPVTVRVPFPIALQTVGLHNFQVSPSANAQLNMQFVQVLFQSCIINRFIRKSFECVYNIKDYRADLFVAGNNMHCKSSSVRLTFIQDFVH